MIRALSREISPSSKPFRVFGNCSNCWAVSISDLARPPLNSPLFPQHGLRGFCPFPALHFGHRFRADRRGLVLHHEWWT